MKDRRVAADGHRGLVGSVASPGAKSVTGAEKP
jgi:hypothetical protein